MYSGLVYRSSPQTKGQSLRTNDSTALCEGNVAIGDDGGFSQRIDVKKFLWGKLIWFALVEFDLVGHLELLLMRNVFIVTLVGTGSETHEEPENAL